MEEEKMDWTRTKDSLPKKERLVVVFWESRRNIKDYFGVAYYDPDTLPRFPSKWWIPGGGRYTDICCYISPDHWMAIDPPTRRRDET